MSKVEAISAAGQSPQYQEWLQHERRGRMTVRLAQLAILVAFLVLWEVAPRLDLINPLFTSYPSTIWPTFLEMLNATPQQASILTHTWSTVLATVVGFTLATAGFLAASFRLLGERSVRGLLVVPLAIALVTTLLLRGALRAYLPEPLFGRLL